MQNIRTYSGARKQLSYAEKIYRNIRGTINVEQVRGTEKTKNENEAREKFWKNLRGIKCPHGPLCFFLCARILNMCPFSHSSEDHELKKFPKYACVSYIINTLYVPLLPDILKDTTIYVECQNLREGLCDFGWHIKPKNLLNPRFVMENLGSFADHHVRYPDADYKCSICSENIRLDRRAGERMKFAILSDCDHVYCGDCMQYKLCYQMGCIYGCPGNKKVIYQRFESKILDPKVKAARFADVPEMPELPTPLNRTFKEQMSPWDPIVKLYEEEGLGVPPDNEEEFLKSLKTDLFNSRLRELWLGRIYGDQISSQNQADK